jgi:hypothetical protein
VISTVLAEHRWLAPTALALLVVVGPFVGSWLAQRRPLALVVTAVSLVPLLALTLVPTGRQLGVGCTVQWMLPTSGRVELVANVVLFAAPVLLLGTSLGRPVAAFLAGSTASTLIELIQAVAAPIGRSCDTTDWLSNTIGSGVGALLAAAALRMAGRNRPVESLTSSARW